MARDIQERAFDFACRIVRLHKRLIRSGITARPLVNQVLRSGTSIGANLQVASAGQSKADFLSKCTISLKEARETLYWLQLLVATELVEKDACESLIQEAMRSWPY